MMREKIGGELVRWNATRFGTVFIFLQSFFDRKDKFRFGTVFSIVTPILVVLELTTS
jgi:hypothetical protein